MEESGNWLFPREVVSRKQAPVLSVIFYDLKISNKLKKALEGVIAKFLKGADDEMFGGMHETEGGSARQYVVRSEEQSKVLNITSCQHYYKDYIIDAVGTGSEHKRSYEHPLYEQKYLTPFDSTFVSTLSSNVVLKQVASKTCFNCGNADHSVMECPFPRNLEAIQRNKANYFSVNGSFANNENANGCDCGAALRYHNDCEECENTNKNNKINKFNNKQFQPGRPLSKELIGALGLSKYDIPPYIYRMRIAGYPPAYGKKHILKGVNFEGERAESYFFYSTDVIIYPGFNAPMPPGTIDRPEYYHCPRINAMQFVIPEEEEGAFEAAEEAEAAEENSEGEETDFWMREPLDYSLLRTAAHVNYRQPPLLQGEVTLEGLKSMESVPVVESGDPFDNQLIPSQRLRSLRRALRKN